MFGHTYNQTHTHTVTRPHGPAVRIVCGRLIRCARCPQFAPRQPSQYQYARRCGQCSGGNGACEEIIIYNFTDPLFPASVIERERENRTRQGFGAQTIFQDLVAIGAMGWLWISFSRIIHFSNQIQTPPTEDHFSASAKVMAMWFALHPLEFPGLARARYAAEKRKEL